MPWRKYTPKKGKYGPIYPIARGICVRRDQRRKWTLYVARGDTRINKTIGTDRDALVKAIKAAESLANKMNSGQPLPGRKRRVRRRKRQPRFCDYADQWYTLNTKRWADPTCERYEQILRLYIRPHACFARPLGAISRKDIKAFLRQIYRHRSPATVESVHAVISGVFNEAIDDEKLSANPATGLLKKILPPKHQRDVKPADPFTIEERNCFLGQAERSGSWAERLILKTMLHAGLRLGEALAMRAAHFNPAHMTYSVSESFKRRCFRRPKFGKIRIVDLPSFLVHELSEYMHWLKKEGLKAGRGGGIDLLFLDPAEGGRWPYSQRKVQTLVRRVCQKAGLRVRNPHDLRHTYATILLMAHQSPGYVQKQLGHSSIAITMDIYCHWIPGEGRQGLEAALGGGDFVPNRVRKPHIFAYMKKRSQ